MLNTAVLMGRLTADPELRHTSTDTAVTSFTLAVDRSYVKPGEERKTDFIDIVAWRSTAEFVCRYFRKGMLVAVQGNIQTRTYDDKDGNRRKAFEIVASNVHFAEPKRDSSYHNNPDSSRSADEQKARAEENASSYKSGSIEDFEEVVTDDDLPF